MRINVVAQNYSLHLKLQNQPTSIF